MNLYKYTYNLVRQIPSGMISSYGAIAKALGDIRASRAVGRMMNQNPNADDMPCFRIVYSDGKLGGFGLGIEDKIRRLKQDNIKVKDNKIVNFEKVFFNDFNSIFPLKKLRKKQIELSEKIEIFDDFDQINTVAGFDVAYPKNDFDKCCGACVVIDNKTKKVIEEIKIHDKILFPYIPTYLTYRESNIIKLLYNKLESKPDLLMIDGNGILHPYGLGIASYIGINLNVPTIGVAKSLLCGKVENNDIFYDDKLIGSIFFSSKKIKKPIFISPGHKISHETSISIINDYCSFKNPEPIRQAHILATKNI
jgi:deoxyribonuclease V